MYMIFVELNVGAEKKTIFYEALCKTANLKKKGGWGVYQTKSLTIEMALRSCNQQQHGKVMFFTERKHKEKEKRRTTVVYSKCSGAYIHIYL